ncbi:MAG: ribosome small subunit-dependent GTPase A [Oscillospiraceae bacterium]|nr:ribosome small subunit-dependent GTPase A [Oscillospiraceae bacterium]MDD4413901.1 ribosome small subunit-dependent GTPase A [Oscillospiraceae bacterium]
MTLLLEGVILKCVGGFYYVEAADIVYECRARGIFRKSGITPVVGDVARISILDDSTGWLEEIGERRNILVRPPVANLDILVIVVSITEPEPNTLVIDKMIAIAEKNRIEPVIVITKSDLQDTKRLEQIYEYSGFEVFSVSEKTGEGIEFLRKRLTGHLSVFCGNSGVGKSSLINALDSSQTSQTGEISKKLGRGRHTTRTAEIFKLSFGGRIVDTPGFSSLDFEHTVRIYKEELASCFRDFDDYVEKCRFTGCSHIKEKDCAVLEAVKNGGIMKERHDNYKAIYEEIKNLKEWN